MTVVKQQRKKAAEDAKKGRALELKHRRRKIKQTLAVMASSYVAAAMLKHFPFLVDEEELEQEQEKGSGDGEVEMQLRKIANKPIKQEGGGGLGAFFAGLFGNNAPAGGVSEKDVEQHPIPLYWDRRSFLDRDANDLDFRHFSFLNGTATDYYVHRRRRFLDPVERAKEEEEDELREEVYRLGIDLLAEDPEPETHHYAVTK